LRLGTTSPSKFNKAPQLEGETVASRLYQRSFVWFAPFGC
jgi:hypothetical protein